MDRRRELHQVLVDLITPFINDDKTHVYFQPTSTVHLYYPCIIYQLSKYETDHADNLPYYIRKRYSVTVIDRNPDSKIPDKVAELSTCASERFYTADNLNHWVFELYY